MHTFVCGRRLGGVPVHNSISGTIGATSVL